MEKILIIDDDESQLESMSCLLEPHYVVAGCTGSAEALARARMYQPDLILLDVMMEEMDGYEVCRRLKESSATRNIPVIFVTALDSVQDEAFGLSLGAIDYLSKPVNGAIALARIANHLTLKRSEDALRRLNLHMEELVRQRTAELSEALSAAKIADRAKDAFLANISHELRTPLSAVIGFSGLAQPLCTNARQRDYLGKIMQAGSTLSAIINDLLDLSKITAGHMALESATFSLRALLDRNRSLMAYQAEEKGLTLVEQIDDDTPDVLLGDPLRLEQILLNLLSNAVKFTARGGIRVDVGVHARQAERVGLQIAVSDTGIGLDEADLQHLFKPFSQTDTSISRKFGGTGLGLAICKHLAEMMDGDISASSNPAGGTTFRVRLWFKPGQREDLPADHPAAAGAQAPTSYRDARVLVVDDQQFNREVVEGLLAVVGIVPQMANNGQEALDLLEKAGAGAFDLVLMDIQMPVMDGLTATRALRTRAGFSDLPVIAMTAHTMAHEKQRSLDAGLNDHIGKPFDNQRFYALLRQWIPRDKQLAAEAACTSAAALPPPPDAQLAALQGIDTQVGLALFVGDEARYRHWLGNFIDEAPRLLEAIRQGLASGQSEVAGNAAHTLKGRSGMLGMNELHRLAATLETALDGGAPADALLARLEQQTALICQEIANFITMPIDAGTSAPPPPDAPPAPSPSDDLPASIAQLAVMLAAGNGDCDAALTRCLDELKGTAWAPCLHQARHHVRNFDFAAARKLLGPDRETD